MKAVIWAHQLMMPCALEMEQKLACHSATSRNGVLRPNYSDWVLITLRTMLFLLDLRILVNGRCYHKCCIVCHISVSRRSQVCWTVGATTTRIVIMTYEWWVSNLAEQI
jgi:hypothetical protein